MGTKAIVSKVLLCRVLAIAIDYRTGGKAHHPTMPVSAVIGNSVAGKYLSDKPLNSAVRAVHAIQADAEGIRHFVDCIRSVFHASTASCLHLEWLKNTSNTVGIKFGIDVYLFFHKKILIGNKGFVCVNFNHENTIVRWGWVCR